MNVQFSRAGGSPLPITATRTVALLFAALLAAGCSADPTPAASDTNQPGAVRPTPVEPVTFFRSQAPACRAYAKQHGTPQVEAARFTGAGLVDALGDGAFLIRDGFGTRLVVKPTDRVVLPASGRDTDEMPAPYQLGCPPDTFKGGTD
jgi:hypothetical protein